jgi:hypothetical protein
LNAPEVLWHSGVGDLVSKFTAVTDWKLAFHATGTPVDDFAALLSDVGSPALGKNSYFNLKRPASFPDGARFARQPRSVEVNTPNQPIAVSSPLIGSYRSFPCLAPTSELAKGRFRPLRSPKDSMTRLFTPQAGA